MRKHAFDTDCNKGRMKETRIRREGEGRAVMAKDMSNVYREMLTKELVQLRTKHLEAYKSGIASTNRKQRADAVNRAELIAQINAELADRIASFGLFV